MLRMLIINLIIATILFAQDPMSVNIGVKGGLNFSNITGNNGHGGYLNEDHCRQGYTFGIVLDKRNSRSSSLQIELLYNDTGSKWGQPFWFFDGWDVDYVIYELQYISLSTYVKFKSNIGSLLKDFDFVIGASYSYNIMARQKWAIEYYSYEFDSGPSDISDEINKSEFGFVYGVKFPFKNRKYYLNFLFYHAISPLYNERYTFYKDDFDEKDDFKNNTFSISMEMFFTLFHK